MPKWSKKVALILLLTITLHVSWLCRGRGAKANTVHLHTRQYSNCGRKILLKMPLVVRHYLFNGHRSSKKKWSNLNEIHRITVFIPNKENINNNSIKVSVYIMQCNWLTRAFRSDLCVNTGIINTRAKTGLQTISGEKNNS